MNEDDIPGTAPEADSGGALDRFGDRDDAIIDDGLATDAGHGHEGPLIDDALIDGVDGSRDDIDRPGHDDTFSLGRDSRVSDDLHGDPVGALRWSETGEDDGLCAVISVKMVASRILGSEIPTDDLVAVATELGFANSGTIEGLTLDQTEAILDRIGIDTSIEHGTLDDLRSLLDEGRSIILAVDSDELRLGFDDGRDDPGADHALVIIGIDDARGVVVLDDPGRVDGQGLELPIEVLLDAWDDADNAMVVTRAGAAVDADAPAVTRIVLEPDVGGDGPLDRFAVAGYVLLPVSLGISLLSRRASDH